MSVLFGGGWKRLTLSAAALVVVVGGAATAAVLVSGPSAPASAATHETSAGSPKCSGGAKITETGSSTVTITPNLLSLSLDVHTTAAQANTALAENNSVTAAVVHALSTGGVASRDLQTTDLTIEPNYSNTGTTVTGYGVDNTVVAKIRKFSTAGTVIDTAVTAGGNDTRIDSLAFSLTQPLRAQSRARGLAVRQAVGHARAIAASAGAKVGGICSIHDDTSTSTTTPIIRYGTATGAVASPSANVPVEAGSETVTARVTMVFALS